MSRSKRTKLSYILIFSVAKKGMMKTNLFMPSIPLRSQVPAENRRLLAEYILTHITTPTAKN